MKKELRLRLLTLCLASAVLSGAALAVDGTEFLTYEVPGTNVVLSYQIAQNGDVTITDCNEDASGELEIPSSIDGKPVTAIGKSAFEYCELTNITVPDSVTAIGCNAFEYCQVLTNITLSKNLTAISDEMFVVCGLTEIVIPDSVTEIGEGAFSWCTELESITIPKSVTKIGDGTDGNYDVFDTCASLNTINIDENNPAFRKVGSALFSKDMRRLVVCERDIQGAYAVPEGVETIDGSAFGFCRALTEISIPDSATQIGRWAFEHCEGLTNIEIPNLVTCIEEAVFWSCVALERLTIPDSEAEIGDNAFWGCDHLTELIIPNSVTSIGKEVCFGCDSLKSIAIPKSVTAIGKYAFGYSDAQKGFIIYGYPGTAAETYAKQNWLFQFISIEEAGTANHTPADIWSYDEMEHWRVCVICNEKVDPVPHTFGAWETIQAATASTAGSRERVCGICGFKQTETIPIESGWVIVALAKENESHNKTVVYEDVPENAWYKAAVDFVTEKGLMHGTGPSAFLPNGQISRAMLVEILYNHENMPIVNGSLFTDVQIGTWYEPAVTWAAQKGIVSGYGNGRFGLNDNITREQLAAVLWRYTGQPASIISLDNFADIGNANGYALPALRWAVENDVISGKGGILDPTGTTTRAEAAQMLMNYFKQTEK